MREMKDSGIEWIGEIPKEWEIIRLCYLIDGYKAGPFGSALIMDKLDDEGEILVYTPETIATRDTDLSTNKYLPDSRRQEMEQFFVEPGDIIFPIVGSLGRAMLIKKNMPEGIINQRLAKFHLSSDKITYPYFMRLFGQSSFFETYIELSCRGSIIVNLTKAILHDMPVPVPPIDEQKRIAAYLDAKCSEINALTADIQSQIDTLEQYKRSVITEAVTKGLNKNVEMKESGIEWIGDIPSAWATMPIKYNFTLVAGATPDSHNPDLWDGDVNWITPADFKTEDVYVKEGSRKLSEIGFKSCSTSMIPAGSIIFSKRAPIGTVAINTTELCTNQGCLGLVKKSRGLDNKYYYYVLSIYPEVFNLFGSGTTFKEISATAFGEVSLPFPPVNEQHRISTYLDAKCSEIDAVVETKKSQLATLDEYKKSNIYEYVTGKKEVPSV